jgi:hypothetical protein
MIKVMDHLQGECIYCELVHPGQIGESFSGEGQSHTYDDCMEAEMDRCGFIAYEQWRERIDFGQAKHCWQCGLSQRICRRLERPEGQRQACEYPAVMLPSMFVLLQLGELQAVVEAVGFQGTYGSEDLYEWLNEPAEGFGREWPSHWMETWQRICVMYGEWQERQGGRRGHGMAHGIGE